MPHKFPNVKPDQSKTRTKEIDQITPTYLIQTIFDSSLLPPPFFAMKTPGLPSTQVSTLSQDLPEVFSSREHLWEGLCLEGYVQWPTLVASIMS